MSLNFSSIDRHLVHYKPLSPRVDLRMSPDRFYPIGSNVSKLSSAPVELDSLSLIIGMNDSDPIRGSVITSERF